MRMGKRFNGANEHPKTRMVGKCLKGFSGFGLEGVPLIKQGHDVAKIIVEVCGKNGVEIEEGDIVVVAQKILSKAEGRIVSLRGLVPSERAKNLAKLTAKSSRFVELVLKESRRVLKASKDVLLVEDKRGLVCINAGIDKSNVEGRGKLALLPENPDVSADKCRVRIKELTGKDVAVVVCDTYSRPFRRGQVNYAIGIAGVKPFKDYRGQKDLFGQVLKVKNVAVIDEIAAAAELLMGQAVEAMPVVVFKGLSSLVGPREKHGIADVFISEREDLFKGTL